MKQINKKLANAIHPAMPAIIAGIAGLIHITSSAAADNASCDRTCLERHVGRYAAALVKHDPTGLPLAANVKVSENGVASKLGEGISWKGITKFKSQPQYVADVTRQEVGYVGVVDDNGSPAFLGLRLKVVNNQIIEVESILTHDGEGGPAFEPEGFIYREAPYIRDVPKKIRSSRDTLVKVANIYWDVSTTGSHVGDEIPYTVDCWHYENGMNTNWERFMNPNEQDRLSRPEYQPQEFDGRIWRCAREAYLSTSNWIKARDRHYLMDEERGLIFNIVYVDVKGRSPLSGPTTTTQPAIGMAASNPLPGTATAQNDPIEGPGAAPLGMSPIGMQRSMAGEAHTMVHFEVMRIVDGKIAREQDVMRMLPAEIKRMF
ncbi:MAG: hypothetical protein QM808_14400 [Steroidobacteraceae bacterium]